MKLSEETGGNDMRTDRRVVRTQKYLKEALLRLMETKPVHSITIKELCECADLNRSTFYDYYKDIYELLTAVHNDLFEEMNIYVKASQKAAEQMDINTQRTFLVAVIKYMRDHSFLFQTLLRCNEEHRFERELFQYFTKQLMMQKQDELTDTMNRYEILYHCAGSFSILRQWILEDCPLSSEQLADIMISSSHHSLSEFIQRRKS